MTGDHRANPRRRGAALEDAILQAAVAELEEVGFAKTTIESIAHRAGAGKASVYKRWPTKVELAAAAVYRLVSEHTPPPGTGTLRGDLFGLLRGAADQLAGPAGEAFRGIVSECLGDPETITLASLSRGDGARQLRRVLREAADRGDDIVRDPSDQQVQAPQALLRMHFLTHGAPIDDAVIHSIIDHIALPLFASPSVTPPERKR